MAAYAGETVMSINHEVFAVLPRTSLIDAVIEIHLHMHVALTGYTSRQGAVWGVFIAIRMQ